MFRDRLWETEERWYLESFGERECALFRDCLEVGNTKLLTQFEGITYEQLNGLAMGVADSPDLANLYGWFCEKRDGIQADPRIAFYGRYIDDCIGIVYANTPQEALATMTELVHIDDCALTWEVGRFQPFLDMMLYIDSDNKLQHLPYRKAKSHQERIPWISSHPLDVKRGTFYGEMSRLATLSSTKEHYLEAMESLVALYVKRGYPDALVRTWRANKQKERWDNRLSIPIEDESGVLVLKSSFNTAWGFFNSSELGSTLQGYMRTWLYRAERGLFDLEYPPVPPGYSDDIAGARYNIVCPSASGEELMVPDIRTTGILDRRTIVSRKRTANLFDITGLWKRSVLEKQDEMEADQGPIPPPPGPEIVPIARDPIPPAPAEGVIVPLHRSGRPIGFVEGELNVQRRSPSPMWVDPELIADTVLRVGKR